MKQLIFCFILIFFVQPLFSQNIIGDWQGALDANGHRVPIVFHFKSDNGKIVGQWDSPSQNAMGLPFSSVISRGDSILLDIKMIGGSYAGKFITKDSIAGIWQQGAALPLNFSRSSANSETTSAPAQQLIPGEKEISIPSPEGFSIYGNLLSKNNKQKLAIIIAGSGPTDKNGNNPLGVKADPYKMLAYALDSQNIATFRFDKRWVGKSIPANLEANNVVLEDYIRDVETIFNYLRDKLGFKDIYLIGHSEGSLIGIVAAQKTKVKGLISVAGAGRPIDVVIEEQLKSAPDSLQKKATYIFDELKSGRQVEPEQIPQPFMGLFSKNIQPFMISWLKYSPQKEIQKLNCPILILQGTCDLQIKTEDANNLHSANPKSTLDIIPSMTHTLKDAGENCENQQQTYTDNTLPLDKLFVKDIVNFIKK